MKRLKSSISPKEPYELYKSDLNWRDDGNDSTSTPGVHVEDPSMADYIKGYKLDPYEMRYWAKIAKADKNPKRLMKIAWQEVDVLSFTPQYLADKILKLWNQIDGSLQNTFEAFTLRYNNELKQKIAAEIAKYGYEVYPILLVDAPMYAGVNSAFIKMSSINKANNLIKICKKLLPTIATTHLAEDLIIVQDNSKNLKESNERADIILNYYYQLFPEDYSLNLIKNHQSDDYFKEFRDIQISDEALTQMEKWDSETEESLVYKENPYNAYDFTSDMRYDTTAPNEYEVNNGTNSVYRLGKSLKKKEIIADEEEQEADIEEAVEEDTSMDDMDFESNEDIDDEPIPTFSMPDTDNVYDADSEEEEIEEETEEEYNPNNKIPLDLVFDPLNQATFEINNLLGQNMRKPPVPVAIYMREDNTTEPDSYSFKSQVAVLEYLDRIYMVYEFFLSNRTNVYAIIQGDRYTQDHKFYDWENVQYRGFYETQQEAANYIKGYLR